MQNKSLVKSIINQLTKLNLYDPLTMEETSIVENELNVKLSQDFITLNSVYTYEFLGLFDFYNFKVGVVGETKYYRENHKLPHEYLVLFSDDVSFVLLKIISEEKSEVIWCDYQDFFNLCNGVGMQYTPTIFPTFTDFYAYLLDEEEKIRAEDKGA